MSPALRERREDPVHRGDRGGPPDPRADPRAAGHRLRGIGVAYLDRVQQRQQRVVAGQVLRGAHGDGAEPRRGARRRGAPDGVQGRQLRLLHQRLLQKKKDKL